MSIVIGFRCGNCGYGPLDVDDNREAPIPNPPISIFDPEGEGQPISSCPRCDHDLPQFWHPTKRHLDTSPRITVKAVYEFGDHGDRRWVLIEAPCPTPQQALAGTELSFPIPVLQVGAES
jgi:hypothetical protein